MNFLPLRFDEGEEGTRLWLGKGSFPCLRNPLDKGAVTVGIRAENFVVATTLEDGFDVRVELIERLGAQTYAYVEMTGSNVPLTVALPAGHQAQPGDTLVLQPMAEKVHFFDANGRAV